MIAEAAAAGPGLAKHPLVHLLAVGVEFLGLAGKLKGERSEKETKAPTRTRTFKDKTSGSAFPKIAKATGKRTGQGDSPGLFLPLPRELAQKFPGLGDEDGSPSHVTVLILDALKSKEDQKKLVQVLEETCGKAPKFKATLGPLSYFDHKDKDRRVAHLPVRFDGDFAKFRRRLKTALQKAGLSFDDKWPKYRPHVTLAYLDGLDTAWDGPVPQGSWQVDALEVWGLPKIRSVGMGSSTTRVAQRYLVSKAKGFAR